MRERAEESSLQLQLTDYLKHGGRIEMDYASVLGIKPLITLRWRFIALALAEAEKLYGYVIELF